MSAGLASRGRAATKDEIEWRVIAFARLLKRMRFSITPCRVADSLRSLQLVDIFNREDFRQALRANLVSCREDQALFDPAFDAFWRPQLEEPEEQPASPEDGEPPAGDTGNAGATGDERRFQLFIEEWVEQNDESPEEEEDIPLYSSREALATKDFSRFDDSDVKEFRRLIAQLAPKLSTRVSRRTKSDNRGKELDLRRALRASLKYGGDVVELPRRRLRLKKTKLVLLCDVSGSMDCYSRFLIQFIYALQNQLHGTETFVFSTRLSRITGMLRTSDIHTALARLSASVQHWSGGTDIGRSLNAFNTTVASTVIGRKSVVVIISDGWDRGDTAVLGDEMRRLRGRSHKIIWLNPLAGSPSYQPICGGMKTALPFVDAFLPAHNLASLVRMTKVLQTVM